jgi:hypothetical protein
MPWKQPIPTLETASALPRDALICTACGYVMAQWPTDALSWPREIGAGDDVSYQCHACGCDLQASAPVPVVLAPRRLDIAELINAGEGQAVDFKDYGSVDSADLQRDLARHIAAFATAGGGALLIGVRDDGTISGINGAGNIEGRDKWRKAIYAASRAVKPAIVVAPDFVEAAGQTVLVVRIPRGHEPVYYYSSRPYLRDGQASRPAEPDEVKALYMQERLRPH